MPAAPRISTQPPPAEPAPRTFLCPEWGAPGCAGPHNVVRRLVATGAGIALVSALVVAGNLAGGDPVAGATDWADVLSEGLFTGLVLVWMVIVSGTSLQRRVSWPLQSGFILLYAGGMQDVADEFVDVHGGAVRLLEAFGMPLGMLVVSLGLFLWSRAYHQALIQARREKDRYRRESLRDDLSGLYNRRHFDDALDVLAAEALRTGKPLCLLVIDMDDFKPYNDRYGHPAGDRVIRAAGGLLDRLSRREDVPCRIGGEEFAILLPDTEPSAALAIAERLRGAFEELVHQADAGTTAVKTVSIGIAAFDLADGPEDLLRHADLAMYRAKRAGKNRVERYRPPATATPAEGSD